MAAGAGRRGSWQALLPVSLVAWAVLTLGDEWLFLPAYCSPSAHFAAGALPGLESVLRFNPPAGMAAGWLTMLLAMMPPLLAGPVAFVWQGSLAPRRLRSLVLFLFGYLCFWMAAGALLLLAAIALHGFAGGTGPVRLAAAASIALLWQASPWKQASLNRCHRLPAAVRSGMATDRDSLGFGLSHGLWCAGACWALMLLPLLAGEAHLAAMALVALFLLAERLDRPRTAAWGLCWPRAGRGNGTGKEVGA